MNVHAATLLTDGWRLPSFVTPSAGKPGAVGLLLEILS